jgi:hypothetical protein
MISGRGNVAEMDMKAFMPVGARDNTLCTPATMQRGYHFIVVGLCVPAFLFAK